jgi:hypothetical protein
MPEVQLKGPRVINGAVRYPVEGLIPVSDDEYDRLVEANAIATDDDEIGDDLDDMKVDDLKSTAELEGVDLGEASKKADIIAAIRAHRANAAS